MGKPVGRRASLSLAGGLGPSLALSARNRSTGRSGASGRSARPRNSHGSRRRITPSLRSAVELRLGEKRRRLAKDLTAFIARARPSHHLCRASDETGPAPASITRPARRCLEAGPWWAPSRLPVVTRRLKDLASRGEHRVLSQARYCVGGPAATECRTSTEANTSSQDFNSHGCLPVNTRSSFLRITPAPGRLRWRVFFKGKLGSHQRQGS